MSNALSPSTPVQPRRQFGYRQNLKDATQYTYGPICTNSLPFHAPQDNALTASSVDAAAEPALQDAEQSAGKPLSTKPE